MWTSIFLVIVSLAILTGGAELLVSGSVSLARRLRISSFFIGLTIVGFGTSTPELFTSILATLRGQPDIAIGNVVGSNVFNVALILGLSALVAPISVRLDEVRKEVWIVIALSTAPFVALASGGVLRREIGVVLIAILVAYLWRGVLRGRLASSQEADLEQDVPLESSRLQRWTRTVPGALVLLALSLLALVAGSALLVESASEVARALGISELVIGLTIVAGGTSAPELFTSLVAAFRRRSEIAIGNILGSNVFNLAGILGLTTLVHPQTLNEQVLRLDAPVMLGVAVALLLLLRRDRLDRLAGAILVTCYAGYLLVLLAGTPGG